MSVYHLFDKEAFKQRMAGAYKSRTIYSSPKNLWHVQFLLFMALGKAILGRGGSKYGPPGARDFMHAMQYMPDISGVYIENPILGIEVMCLQTLYLFTADMRHSAYALVGLNSIMVENILIHHIDCSSSTNLSLVGYEQGSTWDYRGQ